MERIQYTGNERTDLVALLDYHKVPTYYIGQIFTIREPRRPESGWHIDSAIYIIESKGHHDRLPQKKILKDLHTLLDRYKQKEGDRY